MLEGPFPEIPQIADRSLNQCRVLHASGDHKHCFLDSATGVGGMELLVGTILVLNYSLPTPCLPAHSEAPHAVNRRNHDEWNDRSVVMVHPTVDYGICAEHIFGQAWQCCQQPLGGQQSKKTGAAQGTGKIENAASRDKCCKQQPRVE